MAHAAGAPHHHDHTRLGFYAVALASLCCAAVNTWQVSALTGFPSESRQGRLHGLYAHQNSKDRHLHTRGWAWVSMLWQLSCRLDARG